MATLRGSRRWSVQRTKDGWRNYKLVTLVGVNTTEGPSSALQCPGLPVYGSRWNVSGDTDPFVWCRWDATVNPLVDKEGNNFFEIEQLFSDDPQGQNKKCQDQQPTDPLSQPMKISGSFTKYVEEAGYDRFGVSLLYSSFEQIRGPAAEFDASRPQVIIEQNVPSLQFPLLCSMIETVNKNPIWGFPARCVKLGGISWQKQYYGSCSVYFTRTLTFDVNVADDPANPGNNTITRWDRTVNDESTLMIRGQWDRDATSATQGTYLIAANLIGTDGKKNGPNPELNPLNYIVAQDYPGNVRRIQLDGKGAPAKLLDPVPPALVGLTNAGQILIQHYNASDFLQLRIPTSIDT
jgi:hypothetical protein